MLLDSRIWTARDCGLIGGRQGPLAGVHAGIAWARANHAEARFVITAAADTPFFPGDLVQRFLAALGSGEPKLVRSLAGRACARDRGLAATRGAQSQRLGQEARR